MPQIIVTQGAALGLEKCRLFLAEKSPYTTAYAAQAISQQFTLLENQPLMGRPMDNTHDLRELVIPFGSSGYLALYHFDAAEDAIYILAFKHQKEAGY